MPRLGEAIEPDHAERVVPWWRAVEMTSGKPQSDAPDPLTVPRQMPWPID
jgi:hypothetical protein